LVKSLARRRARLDQHLWQLGSSCQPTEHQYKPIGLDGIVAHHGHTQVMTVSAHDVAAALRERLPGLPVKKLHKLLYYCQGHHLAVFDEPLFRETISAWDMGPVVGQLWKQEQLDQVPVERAVLGEAELNTIEYVVARYGALSGRDLEILTHGEDPWQRADDLRRPNESVRIRVEWIRDFFRSPAAADDDTGYPVDSEAVTALLAGADERKSVPGHVDDLGEIRARIAELAAARG
jgi:uncharacterized phage-associated protein